MKHLVVIGILVGALAATGYAQQTAQKAAAPSKQAAAGQKASGDLLGTVRLPRAVKANDQPLPAGTYQVRLGSEEVKPATGASPQSERWVEFVQGGQVKGREVASVVPNAEVRQIAEDKQAPPAAGQARVQLLKGEKYLRVWLNKGGNSYLIHLPPA
ncbi:MAG: hypothetical protein ACM3NQ_11360 [Bacteroidales bacterium]